MADDGEQQEARDADEERLRKGRSAYLLTHDYPTRESWARCCETLSRNKNLTALHVSLHNLTALAFHITRLKPVLEKCRTIESVCIECSTHVDVSGLVRGLSLHGALKDCTFRGQVFARVPPAILVGLFKACRDLWSLEIPLGPNTIGRVCGALAEMTSLKEIKVNLEDDMAPEQLRHLGQFLERTSCLEELHIEARPREIQAMMPGIEEAINGLALNHSVKTADFSELRCQAPYGRAIGNVLQSNCSLKELRLHKRTPQEVRDLSEGLKSNTTLETLSLSVLGDEDKSFVGSLLPLFSALREQKTSGLMSLCIADCRDEPQTASSHDVSLFQEALQGCSVLREISLQTDLGDEEDDDEFGGSESWHQLVQAVINGLCEGSSVQHLKLCGLVRNFNSKILRLLASDVSSLKSLELYDCHLVDENLVGFAEAAARKQRLEELEINDCGELTSSAEFVSLLSTTKSLKKLELNFCDIGNSGAEAFAHALKNQTTLESLALVYCNIKCDGVKALVEMLPKNSTLKEISLDGNVVGGDGAKAIATMLPQTTSLKSISLRGCNIEKDEVEALLEGLENNDSIEEFLIEEFLIEDEDSDAQKRASYLAALNKGGRKSYLEADNMLDQDWLKALGRMEEAGGLSTLNFAVRSKPDFVFVRPDSSTSSTKLTTGKRKRE